MAYRVCTKKQITAVHHLRQYLLPRQLQCRAVERQERTSAMKSGVEFVHHLILASLYAAAATAAACQYRIFLRYSRRNTHNNACNMTLMS